MTEPWVIVTGNFWPRAGQDRPLTALAEHLSRHGHAVHLVGWSFDPALVAQPGILAHRVPRGGADVVGNAFLARAGRRVARQVARERPDARVVVSGGNCTWPDINWLHYLHAAWTPDLSASPRWYRVKEAVAGGWYRRQERRAVRAARVVLTNSRRTRDDAARMLGIVPDRMRVVYYGTDPTWCPPSEAERLAARRSFGLAPHRQVAVFVGGIGHDNRKGADTLLAAWAELCKSPDWDAELLMAGGGRAFGAFGAAVRARGLTSRVRLLGHTDRVFTLLAAADVLVSPVRYEPYGLNVQEALCRGVPALVAATAGVAEQYPDDLADMLLPDPEDTAELARRLRAWRVAPDEWRARVAPLSERLRRRDWDDMAGEVVAAVARA